jgi:hypothetical protein
MFYLLHSSPVREKIQCNESIYAPIFSFKEESGSRSMAMAEYIKVPKGSPRTLYPSGSSLTFRKKGVGVERSQQRQ